jgi:hypothetical protein
MASLFVPLPLTWASVRECHPSAGAAYPPGVEVVFGGGLWPIGQKVGFVELELAPAIEAYRVWTRGWKPLRPSFKEVREARLIDQLPRLLPLEMPYTRRLLVDHGQRWTAIFDNSRSGGDPYPAVAELSRIAGTRGVLAGHTPHEQYPYPATQLHLFDREGDYVRTIDCGVFDSGRWSFEANGPEQPFEEPRAYSSGRVSDRFTRPMLLRYLSALGIEADTMSAYGPAVLVQTRFVWVRWRAALDEARAEAAPERA